MVIAWVPCFKILNPMLTQRVKLTDFASAYSALCFEMSTNRADATSELKPPLFLITIQTLISKI